MLIGEQIELHVRLEFKVIKLRADVDHCCVDDTSSMIFGRPLSKEIALRQLHRPHEVIGFVGALEGRQYKAMK